MKKLILSVAVVLGSLSTFATIVPTQNNSEKVIIISDEYTEIKIEEVPVAVTDALKKAYPTAILSKAYIESISTWRNKLQVLSYMFRIY